MSQIAELNCGYLTDLQAEADRIWTDPMKNVELVAHADAAKAVLENQSVRFGDILSKDKKRILALEWLTACDATTTACSDDCSIDGSDATPECKEYEITCLREAAFKVGHRAYRERTINVEQSIAFNLELRMKMLDEWIAQYILTSLEAGAGTNLYTGGGSAFTVLAGKTTVTAAAWNDNIWGYFDLAARLNKFTNPYGITGTNLYQLMFNRTKEQGNADGKGNFAKMNTIKMYADPENVETISPAGTYLLHKTAVAFASKSWYPLGAANAEKLTADRMAYAVKSRNLPGVEYDVFVERTCVSNEIYDAFKVQLNGLFAINPTPCNVTNNGILLFECA